MKKLFPQVFLIYVLFIACESRLPDADLVLFNANVITLDENLSELEAVAIIADTIAAVGSNELIKTFIGDNTNVVDLEGGTVIPGLIESHAHYMGLGRAKLNLDLMDSRNYDEIVAMAVMVAEKLKPGEWIIGRGWHQEKWDTKLEFEVNGYPLHNKLSEAVPYHPVMLTHASGHALLANKKAMNIAGINNSTTSPEGGRIVRDSLGNAIGIFEEEAEELINNEYLRFLSKKTTDELEELKIRQALTAADECLKKGITTFHDAGADFNTIELYKKLADEGKLKVRLYVMVGDTLKNLKANLDKYKLIGYGNDHLTVRSIKAYIDGALGTRTAWMLNSYEDAPGESGINVKPLSELRKTAQLALEFDYQMCTHAIGDRGNREILNIYEDIFAGNRGSSELRWRIEHVQHLSEKDIARFGELGVIAAMQAIHCTSDAPYVIQRLGRKRAEEGAYVWRRLMDSGAIICNGSDAPVEDVSPLESYYAAVTRKLKNGSEFYPGQKMTRLEALLSYTIYGAYAAFEENDKGSLEPGKLADITVLSKDILSVPDDELLSTEIVMTIVGGKILYEK